MHKNKRLLSYFLPLLVMACPLTAPNMAIRLAVDKPSASHTPAPHVCQVKTGFETGRLNLRSCRGTSCPLVKILREGESLIQTKSIGGWLEVQTASGLNGWVNSKYIICEEKQWIHQK